MSGIDDIEEKYGSFYNQSFQIFIQNFPLLSEEEEQELSRIIFENSEKFIDLVLKFESNEKEIKEIHKFFAKEVKRDLNLKRSAFIRKDRIFKYSIEKITRLSARFPKDKKYKAMLENLEAIKVASDKFITSNFRLVARIAKKYVWRGIHFFDLFQEGCIGLRIAVFRFNHWQAKFSTYGYWWIQQSITRAIADQSKTIRVPVHTQEVIDKLIKISKYLANKINREPTSEEIAEEMGITLEKVNFYLKIKINSQNISLESLVGENSNNELGDFIENYKIFSPEKVVIDLDASKVVKDVLRTLTPREEKVIRMRYGIGEKQGYTLQEIGDEFRVSRERIRQIEVNALKKLQHPIRSKKLKEVYDPD
ncbi:MAG: sigma-70 family RNA polymerase sigma factor [Candidatus Falkowbacteria bacterium]